MGTGSTGGAGDRMEWKASLELWTSTGNFLGGASLPYLIVMRGGCQLCQEVGVRRAVFEIQG